jgi:outer membrane protein
MRATGLLLILGLAASPARGELKLGYVDLQRALGEVTEGKEAKARLKAELDQARSGLEREQSKLQADKLVLDKQSAMMSEEVRTQRLTDWQRRLVEVSQRAEKQQAELQGKERAELKKIFDKMDPIISGIAQREGLSVVLEKTDSGLLYALPTLDLTAELVKTYNERNPGRARPAPASPRKDAGP